MAGSNGPQQVRNWARTELRGFRMGDLHAGFQQGMLEKLHSLPEPSNVVPAGAF